MEIKLVIDDKDVDMNEFVSNIISNVIMGAVNSLEGINTEWKKLKVKITR